jgi:diguanylate cyclase (GGDEF)-like protein
VSIGIATYPNDGKNSRELLEYADAGLYISKENGRNRVSKKQSA